MKENIFSSRTICNTDLAWLLVIFVAEYSSREEDSLINIDMGKLLPILKRTIARNSLRLEFK